MRFGIQERENREQIINLISKPEEQIILQII
jgi:hypothetical protein